MLKREELQAPPVSGLSVRVDRATETATELRVTCLCGRHAIVVCEHPGGSAA